MSRRSIPAAVLCAGLIALVAIAAPGAPAGKKDAGPFKQGAVGRRAYRLYVPPRPPAEPLPLVVALHGCWQTPEDFALGTRLNEAAERRGFLVLYPAQSYRDNPSRCWNWFDPAHQSRGSGEVAELLALIGAVGREREAPPKRVVAIGFSAGGFMAVNLLCAAPELISGVGVAAGGPYRCGLGADGALACMRGSRLDGGASAGACLAAAGTSELPIRASVWQGDRDAVVTAANLPALETMFARVVGGASKTSEIKDGAAHALYRDRRGQVVVESWLVPGLGHAWSGGDPRATHTWPPGPDATSHMLDFLLERS